MAITNSVIGPTSAVILSAELCNGERNGFIKRFCLYINVMRDPVGVGKRDLQRFMEAL